MPPPPERQPERTAPATHRAEVLGDSADARQALLDGVILNVKKKEDLRQTPKQTLQTLFIQNRHEENNVFSGTFNPLGNKNFEKWAGLRDLVPEGYAKVRVTRSNGEVIEGERRPNGSFYTRDGKYVAIWEGDSFSATREATQRSVQEVSQAAPAPVSREQVRENAFSLPEVPIAKTVFVGDSLMVGAVQSLSGSYGRDQIKRNASGAIVEIGSASGGKQTGWMLSRVRSEIANWKRDGVKRMTVIGGVNDIASGKSVTQITDNLKAMYRLAHEAGVQVVACTIPDWDPARIVRDPSAAARMRQTTRELNQWILSQQGAGIEGPDVVVDLYTQTADHSQFPRQRDQLHFTAEGSRNMARLITEHGNIYRG